MFSRTTISPPSKKLIIQTLNTKFEVDQDPEKTYYQLLKYSVNNVNAVNNYKTTVSLVDLGKVTEFSTYSKVI